MPGNSPKPTSWLWPVMGAGLILMSVGHYLEARHAQTEGRDIPQGGKHAVMSPGQGYAASALMCCMGCGFIVRWVQLKRKDRAK